MSVFRNVVFLATLAGIAAGVFMTVLQTAFTVPLILQAETFETAEPAQHHGAAAPNAASTTAREPAKAEATHHHGDEAWAPEDGLERTFFTALANVVTGIGFALLLVAASEMAGGLSGWRAGLAWGFAGFGIFTLAPGLGLPPELPAMPAADLLARQTWWIGTVAATAAGLALIAFRREVWLALFGVALLVVPHVIGAPQPASHESPIPEDLHHSFVVAVTITNLLFWLALGMAVAWLRPRFLSIGDGAARPNLA
jgi:cobalt transporter subunit CbtA